MSSAGALPLSARPIALIGARCVGKTTVGRALARELELGFVDLDEAIAWSAGEGCCAEHLPTIGQLVERLGWEGFRDLESRELERVLAAGTRLVVATGGGVIERARNRELLRERTACVWLRQDIETLRARLRAAPGLRPSLTGDDPAREIDRILTERTPAYLQTAHMTLDAADLAPEELARKLRGQLSVR